MQPFEQIFEEVRQPRQLFSYELSNNTFYNVSGIARLAGAVSYVGVCLLFLAVYINIRTSSSSTSSSTNDDGKSKNGSGDDIDYYDYYYYGYYGELLPGNEVTKR